MDLNPTNIKNLLLEVASGKISVDQAFSRLENLPFSDLEGFAKIDHHRALRHGAPEVIFGQGKTTDQQASIARHLFEKGQSVLLTRTSEEVFEKVKIQIPTAYFYSLARVIVAQHRPPESLPGSVGVIAAGTSDLPVAEEAAVVAQSFGIAVEKIYDVGVAGIHRLLAYKDKMSKQNVLIVVAGMEGALPSVVGGLVGLPVIAVPTSVGYGASSGGWAALLGMLSSCAPGLVVVNIDNGFGAAFAAMRILRTMSAQKEIST